jgi:uncharacterized protein YndB with AHSA1/START domain
MTTDTQDPATLSDASMGEVTVTGEAMQVVFHRRYRKPVAKVWAALTTPERLADWLAEAEIELKPGGAVRLNWNKGAHTMTGRVIAYEPPHVLAWSWPIDGRETVVRFELRADGEGTLLTLTHAGIGPQSAAGASVRTGWHAHLEGLPDAIEGRATPWSTKVARQTALQERYPAIAGA